MSTDHPLKAKLGNAWSQLRYLPRTASLIREASRGWTLGWLILLVVQGFLPVVTVLLTREVVNGIVDAMALGGTWNAIDILVLPVGLLAGTLLLSELLGTVVSWIGARQTLLIEDHIASRIHDTSAGVDLAFYETPEYFDQLHRARDEARHRPAVLVENGGSLVQSLITLVAMGTVLFRFSWIVPVVLVLSTLPALYVVLRHAVIQHRWRQKNTADERRTWYYDHELTSPDTAAEIRLFGLGDHFRSAFQKTRARLRGERLRLSLDQGVGQALAGVVALGAAAGCLVWMGWRTVHGQLSLGDLALFFAAFRQGQQMMRSLLTNAGDIYRNLLFLGDLFVFLDLEPKIVGPSDPRPVPARLEKGIDFAGVSFAYPGTGVSVLSNFDLSIPAGRITAIVGPNGVGKSTLLKLICRLYDPTSGAINVDGTSLSSFDIARLRESIAVLFQKPVTYSETVRRNIAMACLDLADGEEVKDAAADADAVGFIEALPKKFDTMLGRWFADGAELSVGEWQRIALARAFLRNAPIVLLDEPTNAMDAWAEAKWMGRLKRLLEGKTALLITHRFTTAMKADLICVMHGGRIVERGTHEDLLKTGGRYASSWHEQMGDFGPNPDENAE